MSKQRTLIALDWLMPVLQDVFDDLGRLLQSSDQATDWSAIAQALHQVSGALTLTNQRLLATLATRLEQTAKAIDNEELANNYLPAVQQGMALLRYEIEQLQRKQQLHRDWVIDRINFFSELLGEAPFNDISQSANADEFHVAASHQAESASELPLLSQLPVPSVSQPWQADQREKLTKLWRYCSLRLLQTGKNDPETLNNFAKVADFLASTPLNPAFRQVWHLVSIWFLSQALNEEPTPEQYAVLLSSLEGLIGFDPNTVPDLNVGRLAVDVLLQLGTLTHKTEAAQQLLNHLNMNKVSHTDTLFSDVLQKLEQTIFQVYDPQTVLPNLHQIRSSLANRGWIFYEHQVEQIIADTELMAQDSAMASSLSWQVERQLQDLYSQLLDTSETLDKQIGLTSFAYASNPEKEAVRQTRLNVEKVKLAFNTYTQTHDLSLLELNDELVSIIQVFGVLGMSRAQELVEQLRLLMNRLVKHDITVLNWDTTDAIAEMIARLELFLDYLSHQRVSEDLLNQTQTQINRANVLVKNIIDNPIDQTQLPTRQKVFEANTLVYDDEGEKVVELAESSADANTIGDAPVDNSVMTDAAASIDDNVLDSENTSEEIEFDFSSEEDTFDFDNTQRVAECNETADSPVQQTAIEEVFNEENATQETLLDETDNVASTETAHVTFPSDGAGSSNLTSTHSDAYLAAKATLKPDDYDTDEEIREIFIEEVDEVLSEMDNNLPAWQANPSDLALLKEVRRGFHTIKGSGRMVGAFQVGEMAWAVENMLNRVLDNTLPVSDELVSFIGDTRQKIPTLVADFANKREPSIDPAITVLQANNLLQQQPINKGLTTSEPTQTVDSEATSEIATDDMTADDLTSHEPVFDGTVAQSLATDESALASVTDEPVATSQAATAALPAVIQQAYDELTIVTDEPGDPEIQEIYIEEAQEVLETITPLYETWKQDPTDIATLKDIRRGFHTLKGSGRMVGANQLGELGWSIENMLNRVLDNTIAADAGVVSLVGDVIHAFGGLVDIFAQNRTDYPEQIKVWSAIANAYAKKQGDQFDYQSIMSPETQSAVSEAIESTIDDNLTTADAFEQTSAVDNEGILITEESANASSQLIDKPTDAEQDNAQAVEEDETAASLLGDEHDSQESTDYDENAGVTDDVFLEEAQELLGSIDNFIEQHRHETSTYISDELVRAFHTLRGGAALSELPRVYALSAALEESLGELMRKEVPLNAEQLEVLSEAKTDLQQYISDYEAHRSVSEQSSDAEDIDEMTQQLLNNVDTKDNGNANTVHSLLELGIDELLDASEQLPEIATAEDEAVVEFATIREAQAEKLANACTGLSYVNIPEALQTAYNKLIQYPQFIKDEAVLTALQSLHNQLIAMFDAIAAGLNVQVDETAIANLSQQLQDKQHQAELAAIEYEPVVGDTELVAIFLEESQLLQAAIQKSFNQWQNNLTNFDSVKELQREFHTLKGGSNMTGIESISALSYRAERLYQAIQEKQLDSDPDIVLVMQRVHETIATQLTQVHLYRRSFFADKLIAQLDALLAKELSPHNLVLAVPLVVELNLNQEETDNAASENDAETAENNKSDPLYVQEIINNFEQRRLDTWHGQEPDEDILAVFLEEAKELIDSSSQHLQEFRSNTNDIAALQALQRELHTIKGGARMVGAESIATLAHEMETIYEELGSRRKPATRMIGNLLAACHDWLASSMTVLENVYNPQTPTPLIKALQDFSHNPDSLKEIPAASLASQLEQIEIYKSSLQENDQANKSRDLSVLPSMNGNFEVEQEQSSLNAEMVRVSAGLMERMINLSGESAINRSRIEMGMTSLTNSIEEMGSTVQRLADQLRRMETELEIQILAQIGDEHDLDTEFDPLEMDQYSALNQLSKSLSESASDLLDIKTTMLDRTRDTENLLLQLSRTQADLQEGLMNSRTVPFSRITPRLQRIARQTATELGKSVELRIINDEGEIDRNILERITSPLEHMLRNAVDHGIEKTQERLEAGKSRTGLITLEIAREGGEIVIHLTDDGKGINVDAVRKKAIEQGLLSEDDTSLKPLDIMQYIFNAGLSTAKTVSQISGRGVGMDVVQSEVKQLGGVVLVDSELGKGSRFTMRLPLTVAVSDALVVRAADKYYAVPLVQIERVIRVNAETIYQFHESDAATLDIDGQGYRLRYLNQILYGSDPLDSVRQQSISVPVIIIRTETGQNMALQVDAIAGSRIEVVVKPLGRQLSHIAGISAATIMGDGSVMLILDLIALMRNASAIVKADQQKAASKSKKAARKPVVLIIDDSVTVRKVTSRLLERNGYEAQVATDGVDALEKLQDMTPDLMLLDIEMPRMDGFEVANQVRHTNRLKDIPIIMITSRTGEKHRERAMAIGVNEYMGKPFQEQTLLDTIAGLIQQQA